MKTMYVCKDMYPEDAAREYMCMCVCVHVYVCEDV